MKVIKAIVPGKVILHGEHSVVYGKAAIATSVGLTTTVTLSPAQDGGITIKLVSLEVEHRWDLQSVYPEQANSSLAVENYEILNQIMKGLESNPIARKSSLAVLSFYIALLRTFQSPFSPFFIEVKSEIPLGSGLGSSAAFSVGVAAVLLGHMDPDQFYDPLTVLQHKIISKWALQMEYLFHSKPSGIDTAVCSLGGALLFQDRKIAETLSRILPFQLLLVDTQESRNTDFLVKKVRTLSERHPAMVDRILEAMDSLTLESWETLSSVLPDTKGGDSVESWAELWPINHLLLSALGVSHPKLDDICHLATKAGMAAKLTGAGGGGFAIVLIPPGFPQTKVSRLKETLSSKGYRVYETAVFEPKLQLTFS